MKVKETCCACKADFKKAVDEIVDKGTLTSQEHKQMQADVNAAFGTGHPHEGMSGTLAGTHEHHRLHHEPHHKAHPLKK